jgi:hypothetical protein
MMPLGYTPVISHSLILKHFVKNALPKNKNYTKSDPKFNFCAV